MVKNPPANAGATGLITGLGNKVPQALAQLSSCASIMEPMSPRAHVLPPQREASVVPARCN